MPKILSSSDHKGGKPIISQEGDLRVIEKQKITNLMRAKAERWQEPVTPCAALTLATMGHNALECGRFS